MLILGGGADGEGSKLIFADLSAENLTFDAVDVYPLPPNADPRADAQVPLWPDDLSGGTLAAIGDVALACGPWGCWRSEEPSYLVWEQCQTPPEVLRSGGTLAVSQNGQVFFGGGSRSDLWVTSDVCESWTLLSA